jgi:catechol 2,3-dioxygenase-like lactoylglutathione lyase family enzyme
MKIKLTSVYVDDQEKALRFYSEVLGFVKKADFSQGPFRWLTWSHQRTRTARNCSSH